MRKLAPAPPSCARHADRRAGPPCACRGNSRSERSRRDRAGRARGASTRGAESARPLDQVGVIVRPDGRRAIEDRRVGVVSVERFSAASTSPRSLAGEGCGRRRGAGSRARPHRSRRRFQVRQMADARQAKITGTGNLRWPCVPSSAAARCDRARLQGKARGCGCDARLARSSKPTRQLHRRRDRCRPAPLPCRQSQARGRRIGGRPDDLVDDAGGEIGHGLAPVQWAPAGRPRTCCWKLAARIAEGRAGADEHRRGIAVRAAAQRRLRDHAAERMTDQHRALQARARRSPPRHRRQARRSACA